MMAMTCIAREATFVRHHDDRQTYLGAAMGYHGTYVHRLHLALPPARVR